MSARPPHPWPSRLLLLFALAAPTACGSDPVTKDSSAPQYDGVWSGDSTRFSVTANQISNFSLSGDFGPCSGTADDTTVVAPIDDGAFDFEFAASGISTAVSGIFDSEATAHGTFGQLNFSVVCGSSFVTGYSSGFAWNATKN